MPGTNDPADDASNGSPAAQEPRHAPSITPGLVLVATPIGNLDDIAVRAIHALRTAELILCEDTRTTARLLQHYNIGTRTEALHDHNEQARIPALLARLRHGARIALVSDAGTPLVSDPGFRLVRAAIAENLPITAIPGPNAAIMALILSGLPPQPFLFLGFPPPRSAARLATFGTIRAAERAGLAATLLWHEAPHRLAETLVDLATAFPGRQAAIARELTKRFEEVRRATLPELAAHYAQHPARGEITIIVAPAPEETTAADDLETQLRQALEHHTLKDAAALVTAATGLPKKLVYAKALELNR